MTVDNSRNDARITSPLTANVMHKALAKRVAICQSSAHCRSVKTAHLLLAFSNEREVHWRKWKLSLRKTKIPVLDSKADRMIDLHQKAITERLKCLLVK